MQLLLGDLNPLGEEFILRSFERLESDESKFLRE